MLVPPQNGVHDLPLYSDPSTVNDANLLESFVCSLKQIFLYYISYFTGLKGMQIDIIFNRNFHRFGYFSSLLPNPDAIEP